VEATRPVKKLPAIDGIFVSCGDIRTISAWPEGHPSGWARQKRHRHHLYFTRRDHIISRLRTTGPSGACAAGGSSRERPYGALFVNGFVPSVVLSGTEVSAGRKPKRSAVVWTGVLCKKAMSCAPAARCAAVTQGASSTTTG